MRYVFAVVSGLFLIEPALRAEVIYENNRIYSTNFVTHTEEYGDEINLAGSARTITDFQFEYFGDFNSNTVATVEVRIYANDGPGRYPEPATLLYGSAPLEVQPGFNTVTLNGLNLEVPSTITWTVQFSGLSGTAGDKAGLLIYEDPQVGSSYRDYWRKVNGSFVLYSFFGFKPKANFGARVLAGPDPPVRFATGRRLANGFFQFRLTGPIGERFTIEYSGDLRTWNRLTAVTFPASTLDFVDSRAAGWEQRFYRVVPAP